MDIQSFWALIVVAAAACRAGGFTRQQLIVGYDNLRRNLEKQGINQHLIPRDRS